MVLMTQLGESSMTPEGEEKENGKAVVSFHVLVFMVLFSMIAVFVCARTWMRLRSEGCLIVCRSADVFQFKRRAERSERSEEIYAWTKGIFTSKRERW